MTAYPCPQLPTTSFLVLTALLATIAAHIAYAFKVKTFATLLFICLLKVGPLALAQTITMEPAVDGLLTVHATVNGHEGTFLFDSGSGFSSISPQFAALVGCRPWGQITGFRMTGQRLDMQHCDQVTFHLGNRSFAPTTVGVFDIAKLLPSEVGQVDGTIALDVLSDEAFTLSYGGRFLRLLDRKALIEKTAGHRSMPIHVVRDAEGLALTVNLPVNTSAGTGWFEMDSGNTSSLVLVNKTLAPLFHLVGDAKENSVSLTLSDGSTFSGPARVLDLILDGNLGTSFLSKHDVTIDLVRKTAWVSSFVPLGMGNR